MKLAGPGYLISLRLQNDLPGKMPLPCEKSRIADKTYKSATQVKLNNSYSARLKNENIKYTIPASLLQAACFNTIFINHQIQDCVLKIVYTIFQLFLRASYSLFVLILYFHSNQSFDTFLPRKTTGQTN